jgi:AraC-like DNA-binding protein
MVFEPTAPSNFPPDVPSAAHPCRPLVHSGACGLFCDFLRATLFRDHVHPKLQIAVTGDAADCVFRRQMANGRWLRTYLKGAHIIVIPPGVRHGARWRRPACLLTIMVESTFALAAAGRSVREVSILPLRRYSETKSLIGELCAEFWKECQQPGPLNEVIVGGLAEALAGQILRAHFAPTRNEDPQRWLLMRTKLADVRDHVEQNPTENLSLKHLAARVGLNPSYFGQLFRAATGLPPQAYVLGVRVRLARELLRGGQHSATMVAHMVGFSSQPVMNAAFRRLLGSVPTDYKPGGERNRRQIEKSQKRPRWIFC